VSRWQPSADDQRATLCRRRARCSAQAARVIAPAEPLEKRIALSVNTIDQVLVSPANAALASSQNQSNALTAEETHLLYLVNRTRQFPQEWATRLSVTLPSNQRGPFAPLVANASLMEAARLHSQDMLSRGVLGHMGGDGSSPGDRAVRAGYPTTSVSENVYWASNGGNWPSQDVAARANDGWFTSSGHRGNMLNADWTEVGVGFAARQGSSGSLPLYGTEVFGRHSLGPYLTGVAFLDRNGNGFYEPGEGLGGVVITVTDANGASFVTTTAPAGNWTLPVSPADYVVTASGGGFSGTSSAPVRVGSRNVAVDFVSGSPAAWVSFVQHVNSAPVLTTTGVRTFAPVMAGTVNPRGQTVGDLLGADFSDVDPLSPRGIAVTATTVASGGSWQFSTDRGVSWQSLGSPTIAAARLLRSTDMLRFVPGNSAPATASLSYRAWDQTAGSYGGVANTSSAGGSTAFSSATATANIHVVSSNTAPVLSSAGTNPFHPVAEDTANPPGSPVRHLVGSGFSDSDPGTPVGIAVIGATGETNGVWQYSLDEGATWSVLGTVSDGAAILLSGSNRLRFVPAADYNGTVTLSYRAWDQSTGGAGDRVTLSGGAAVGGSTGFSTATVTTSLTVTPVNDAPVFIAGAAALRLRPVPPNATQQQALGIGTRVGDLLGNAVHDVDQSPLRGIAIIGTGGNGNFWWNSGSGGWSGITAGPHFATLLRDTDYIYFHPSSGFSGTSTLTFRLWDRTSGTRGHNGADLSNPATSTGGSTAFGTEILEARVFVGAVGTPPSAIFGSPTRGQNGRVVASIPLSLSRAVSGLDPGDLTLSRDGTPVPLLGARVEGSSTSFTVAGLEAATAAAGVYTLRLVAAGSGITDEAGNPLSGEASITFVVGGDQAFPAAPTSVLAAAGNAQASLTWTAPSSNGGAAITNYIVQYSSNNGSSWTTFNRSASTATSATVTGLANGTTYVFRVAAVNSVGTGAYSATSNSVTGSPRISSFIDLDGNGIADLIWQSSDGIAVAWLDGHTPRVLGGGGGWTLAFTGDFNADRVTDLVWRNSGGVHVVWLMNADGTSSEQRLLGGGGGWEIEASGDYNGDGRTDIIWRNSSNGANVMWLMSGGSVTSQSFVGGDSNWRLVSADERFDANGDGRTDLIWRSAAGGVNVLWRMNGGSLISSRVLGGDADWRIVGTGDFDGDGNSDLLWRHGPSGSVYMWLLHADGNIHSQAHIGGDASRNILLTMDADGDGKTDIFWRMVATGETQRWLLDGTAVRSKTLLGGGMTWRLLGRPGTGIL
jgi:uncharacterized protein YkwD